MRWKAKDWLILTAVLLAWGIAVRFTGSDSLCYFRNLTGLPCPGCGLTHAAIALWHGEWGAAWRFHPGIYLLAAGAVIFTLLRGGRARSHFCIAVAILLIGYYLWRMAAYFPRGPYPMVWSERSWIGTLWGFFQN